ncbi:MAG: LicD family protein, partial [Mogibacterium diversum]|nr:LicD family protein [Mogibacterium diversum]
MTTYNVDAFPEIKDVQRVELDILIKVARLCEERGFTYFIESGTALGAVRHGGFIP